MSSQIGIILLVAFSFFANLPTSRWKSVTVFPAAVLVSRSTNSSSKMDRDELQKPKPTTKGKQMAGPSYVTGLKAKRTSHSDDDSDSGGSESGQPPLKKQLRRGTKQADKSVEINNDATTPDLRAADTNAVDEYTSPGVALENDLVLETLFKYVNRSDLLSCRVVNKQWQYEATKELRRRKLVIRFSFRSHGNQITRSSAYRDICRRIRECRTPSLLSSFQVKTDSRTDLGAAGPTSIFTTVGNHLKNFTLHLNCLTKKCSFRKSSLMVDLHNLLCVQAPNLEHVEIKFDLPREWRTELLELDSSDRPQKDYNEFELLPNLKTFLVSGTPPPNFVGNVINAAVNLRSFGGCWSAVIKYLMGAEGRAKIHLLKSLGFQLALHPQIQWNQPALELVESFLTEHKQHLQLETFDWGDYLFRVSASLEARTVSVFNQILESSSGSLQKVTIPHGKWFKELLIIPRLPQLKEISFDCVCVGRSYITDNDGFFPRGFNPNTSFPNVSTIVLLRCTTHLFRRFGNRHRVGMEMTEPVPSIRYIILNDKGKKGDIAPPLATVTDFRRVFPNIVSISYVNSDKYYKV